MKKNILFCIASLVFLIFPGLALGNRFNANYDKSSGGFHHVSVPWGKSVV